MNRKWHVIRFLIADIISAGFAWAMFFIFRKKIIEPSIFGYNIPIELGSRFILGLLAVPLFWVILYYFTGFYKYRPRRSKLNVFGLTLGTTLGGVVMLFFVLLLDDTVFSYKTYYTTILALFTIHFLSTIIPRLIITYRDFNKIKNGKLTISTLLVGGNKQALNIYNEISSEKDFSGNCFVGFVTVIEKADYVMEALIPRLGNINDIRGIIEKSNIEEVIVAIEGNEHKELNRIINMVSGSGVTIKALPSLYDILAGKVKMTNLFGTPLIQVSHELMPVWEENLKYFIDKFASAMALLITLPACIVLAIIIKITSKGPVIYSHERIGRYGKPFTIFKFRSMYIDAEKNGPELSRKNDRRLTPIGRFMRQTKLDEIPNFFNVLIGDMSLVGPRPERKYFIDQIVQKAPHYIHLQKVRPGITSWGQVKYGYAENVEQMIKRLRYDLLYIENMSLVIDFKILFYTFLTVIKGRGI